MRNPCWRRGCWPGEYARLALSGEELYAALEEFPVVMEDTLPTSRHPLRPRGLIAVNAKQLSSYGGSLETAVSDLEHYRATGSAVLLLCAGEIRANNLRHLLEERGIPGGAGPCGHRHARPRGGAHHPGCPHRRQ